ncbi:hypothetical protein [Brevundimonas diminuta]|uniref:hypothetical protein n=1 Tax=Brevundimonas diminuta TaxID=293 RepID=UPI002092840C|nr:hypothetical protein [Brevundimonas diminuta]
MIAFTQPFLDQFARDLQGGDAANEKGVLRRAGSQLQDCLLAFGDQGFDGAQRF